MHDPSPTTAPMNILDMLAGDARPYNQTAAIMEGPKSMLEGSFASLMNKMRREAKQAAHDARIKENYKLCRKQCREFKCQRCWEKTFEQQKECYNNKYRVGGARV